MEDEIMEIKIEELELMYQEYEKLCEEQRKKNNEYLDIFENDLIAKGFVPKTVRKHLQNVNFYINVYLLREEPLEMQ